MQQFLCVLGRYLSTVAINALKVEAQSMIMNTWRPRLNPVLCLVIRFETKFNSAFHCNIESLKANLKKEWDNIQNPKYTYIDLCHLFIMRTSHSLNLN